MIPRTFLTFAKKKRIWVRPPTFGPQHLGHFFDFWPSGGPSAPREYFPDNRAENPVPCAVEILDLVVYGPPWREKDCQFWDVFLVDCWANVGILCSMARMFAQSCWILCKPGTWIFVKQGTWIL